MKANILGTFITKSVSGILNLLLIVLTTQFLGAVGKGEIGIFILNLTVILMASDVVGGAGLIYVTPRSDVFKVAVSSYCWAIFSSVIICFFLRLFHFTPEKYLIDLFLISLIVNATTINANILVAKEKIKQSNVLSLIQIIVQIIVFAFLILMLDRKHVNLYFYSIYISYGICALLGIFFIKKQMLSFSVDGLLKEVKKMFNYGIFVQTGNFIQLMNYRLGYYLLEYFHGAGAVGIYSTGTSLCEAVWIISNSISRVQYARISNTTDISYAQSLSARLSKISFFATVIAMLPLIFVPENFYELIFGAGFGSIKMVAVTLFLGTCSMGLTAIYSHYFSGTGKVRINTIAAATGLIFTLLFGFLLIPRFGLTGAGITSSISYLTISVFLLIFFLRDTQTKIISLLPTMNDMLFFKNEIKYLFAKKS